MAKRRVNVRGRRRDDDDRPREERCCDETRLNGPSSLKDVVALRTFDVPLLITLSGRGSERAWLKRRAPWPVSGGSLTSSDVDRPFAKLASSLPTVTLPPTSLSRRPWHATLIHFITPRAHATFSLKEANPADDPAFPRGCILG